MIVPCCTAYDMLLVCRMRYQEMLSIVVGLVRPSGGGKGGKSGIGAREKWVTSFLKRQV